MVIRIIIALFINSEICQSETDVAPSYISLVLSEANDKSSTIYSHEALELQTNTFEPAYSRHGSLRFKVIKTNE